MRITSVVANCMGILGTIQCCACEAGNRDPTEYTDAVWLRCVVNYNGTRPRFIYAFFPKEGEMYRYDQKNHTLRLEGDQTTTTSVYWMEEGIGYHDNDVQPWLRLDRRTLQITGARYGYFHNTIDANGSCEKMEAQPLQKNQI